MHRNETEQVRQLQRILYRTAKQSLPTMLDPPCSAVSQFADHHKISSSTHAAAAASCCRLPFIRNSDCPSPSTGSFLSSSPLWPFGRRTASFLSTAPRRSSPLRAV